MKRCKDGDSHSAKKVKSTDIRVLQTLPEHRLAALVVLLRARHREGCVVRVSSESCVNYLVEVLIQLGIPEVTTAVNVEEQKQWKGLGVLVFTDPQKLVVTCKWMLRWEPPNGLSDFVEEASKATTTVLFFQDCEVAVVEALKTHGAAHVSEAKLPIEEIRATKDKQDRLSRRVYRMHFWGYYAYKDFMKKYLINKETHIFDIKKLPLKQTVRAYSIYPPPKMPLSQR